MAKSPRRSRSNPFAGLLRRGLNILQRAAARAQRDAVRALARQAASARRAAAAEQARLAKAAKAAARAAAKQSAKAAKASGKTAGKATGMASSGAAGRAATSPARAPRAQPKPPAARSPAPARVPAASPRPRPATRARAGTSPAAPDGPGAWTSGVVVAAGGARRYHLYRPASLATGERAPLVVMLHGCGQDGAALAASSGMNRLAERERCLVLYPEQDRLANLQGCWNWFDTRGGRAQAEATQVLAAIDAVCQAAGADARRVVVAGLSAGAGLAALLAVLHPQRLAAVVMHSGVPPGTADSTLTALRAMQGRRSTAALPALPAGHSGAHYPPLLVIHGDADPVVALRNAQAAAQVWAAAAGPATRATAVRTVQRGQRRAVAITEHRLRGRVVSTLAVVRGLGHAWSGGAAGQRYSDPTGPDASRMVWAFAKRQFEVASITG